MKFISIDIFNKLLRYINKKYFTNENSIFLYS
jgi:hypothetical protein